ncbi:NADH:ubiquinone reductase (Na(+)-transporting) subunit F [bacterium]|jgi:Na+-transporting NADH:ubiquinone oxidoreductase subunit F|nr:NADH:ubiquinone reductase (Na(+)-transporting) subunit F [bacterium]|tara:strand:+ start:1213 stop:2445 length:1233 start_codon:yes stop_codon:yes gene_type:complete
MIISTTIASVLVICSIIFILVNLLLTASQKLQPQGDVTISVNEGSENIVVKPGESLLSALSSKNIFLPSACGGGGTCAACKCQVIDGGGEILATEKSHISRSDAKDNWRLACQVKVRNDLNIKVADEVLSIKKWECTVRSNDNVATFIKELVLELPEGENLNFKSGGYIQIDIPKYKVDFSNFDIEKQYHEDWDKFKIWDFKMKNEEEIFRAYSMANHPAEGNIVMLNVRIATPPPRLWNEVPPGIASSFMFDLKKGNKVTISGPYGDFFIKDTEREMIYIGGGAGMAPLRSHLFHLFHTLKTNRKVSYWYGARSKREMFYDDQFKKIQEKFPNFSYNVALSDPMEEDKWSGFKGFIHQVVLDNYLEKHEDPTEVEYYLCGPPMMNTAVTNMLVDLGVEDDMIDYDDFGG